jgi:transcriptional regulator with XRE-family HTH domain
MTIFGERLKVLREQRSLSQEEFGRVFNVAQTTIGMYERGNREPNFEKLKQFADFFGVSIDYLIGHTDDPSKQYSPVTRELLDLLHLSDDELFELGPHTLEGKVLTKDEFLAIITLIRTKRQLEEEQRIRLKSE